MAGKVPPRRTQRLQLSRMNTEVPLFQLATNSWDESVTPTREQVFRPRLLRSSRTAIAATAPPRGKRSRPSDDTADLPAAKMSTPSTARPAAEKKEEEATEALLAQLRADEADRMARMEAAKKLEEEEKDARTPAGRVKRAEARAQELMATMLAFTADRDAYCRELYHQCQERVGALQTALDEMKLAEAKAAQDAQYWKDAANHYEDESHSLRRLFPPCLFAARPRDSAPFSHLRPALSSAAHYRPFRPSDDFRFRL